MGCTIQVLITFVMTLWCASKAKDLYRDGPNLIMTTIVDTLDNLSLQLKKQEESMQAKLEELQTTMESRFREQEEKMDSKMEEFQATMESKFGEQHELLSTLHECSSRDQLSAFQDLFTKDDCRDGSHTCSKTATCMDSLVPYKCACLTGYSGDGFTCQDIDECAAGKFTCPENEKCSNITGSYNCICQNGYRRDGDSCQDIDECAAGNFTCPEKEKCSNIPGSYNCICQNGYRSDGDSCQDIDECAVGNIKCPENEKCSNIPGNFSCICQNGYHRHGDSCQVCASTDLYMEDLGCITLLNNDKMNWDDAKSRCQASGKRLLENIKVEHLEPLKEYFYSVLNSGIEVWIGVKHSKWISTGETIDDALWVSGQPDGGTQQCVVFSASSSTRFGLADGGCSWSFYPLCQVLL